MYKKTGVTTYNLKNTAVAYMTHTEGLGKSVVSNQGREMILSTKTTNSRDELVLGNTKGFSSETIIFCVKKGLNRSKIHTRTMSF